jgi:hypothetical protein
MTWKPGLRIFTGYVSLTGYNLSAEFISRPVISIRAFPGKPPERHSQYLRYLFPICLFDYKVLFFGWHNLQIAFEVRKQGALRFAALYQAINAVSLKEGAAAKCKSGSQSMQTLLPPCASTLN